MQATSESAKANPPEQADSSDKCTFVVVPPKKVIPTDLVTQKVLEQFIKEKSVWKGLDIESTGHTGNGFVINDKKKQTPDSEKKKEQDERSRSMMEMFNKFLIEEAKLRQKTNKYYYSVISFRAVKDSEILKEDCPLVAYMKSSTTESNLLLYKMMKSDSIIVRSILEANGAHYTDGHNWNIMWSNGHTKPYLFEGLNEFQRINHFPSSFEITRKDRMCSNIVQAQQRYGKSAFNIIPDTYVLPDEFSDFYAHFHELRKSGAQNIWILKPNALSRGRGIHLITDTNDVPIDEPCVISRYIPNPLLINSYKFDLRIYAVVTSFDPLRIYIYNEGLARFCTEKYDPTAKDNRFSHLTNYSVNKKNEKFIPNQKADMDDVGQKWSISALNKHLEKHGVDIPHLWAKIYDLIIRTFIAAEPAIFLQFKKVVTHRTNCFELFGFDVLLDSDLKPWLMEVNLSPSLDCDAPLDIQVKSNLIADLFTLIGVRQFDRRKDGAFCGRAMQQQNYPKKRITLKGKSVDRNGEDDYKTSMTFKKLSQIPPKYREIIIETLEEYERRRNFLRIYPAKGTNTYDNLFDPTRVNHKIVYKYLYGSESVIPEKDLFMAENSLPQKMKEESRTFSQTTLNTHNNILPKEPDVSSKATDEPEDQEKIIITGDDILIEYVGRLIQAIKVIKDSALKARWIKSIENFITHEIWHTEYSYDSSPTKLWKRLEMRHTEMMERRKRMAKASGFSKCSLNFEIEFNREQQKKQVIIQVFSVSQLEEMLKSSTKNVAYDVVSCLIPTIGAGVLFNIVTWLSTFKRAQITTEHYTILDQKHAKEYDEDEDAISNNGNKNLNDSNLIKEEVKRTKEKACLTPLKNSSSNADQGGSNSIRHGKPLQIPKTDFKIDNQKEIVPIAKKSTHCVNKRKIFKEGIRKGGLTPIDQKEVELDKQKLIIKEESTQQSNNQNDIKSCDMYSSFQAE